MDEKNVRGGGGRRSLFDICGPLKSVHKEETMQLPVLSTNDFCFFHENIPERMIRRSVLKAAGAKVSRPGIPPIWP